MYNIGGYFPGGDVIADPATKTGRPSLVSEGLFSGVATAISMFSLLAYAAVLCVEPPCINNIRNAYGATPVSDAQLGMLFPMLMAGFIPTVIWAGRISDKYGKLPAIAIGNAIMTGGLLLFAGSHSFNMALVGMCIMGIGGGFSEGTSMALVADLHTGPRQTSWMNISQAIFGIGAIGSPLAISALLHAGMDWRQGFLMTAALCAISAVAAFVWMLTRGEKPHGHQAQDGGWRELAGDRLVRWLCVGITLYVGAELGTFSWLTAHFKRSITSSESLAAASGSFFWLGILLGRTTGAWASRYLREVRLITIALAGAIVADAALLLVRDTQTAFACCVFLGFCLGPIFPTIVAVGGAAYPKKTGLIAGILLAFGSFGGAVVPGLIGFISSYSSVSLAMWTAAVALAINLVVFLSLGSSKLFQKPAANS